LTGKRIARQHELCGLDKLVRLARIRRDQCAQVALEMLIANHSALRQLWHLSRRKD
jgi:hypothetical protein